MEVTNQTTIRQPATLHLVGGTNVGCAITELSSTQARVQLDNSKAAIGIQPGDLAELHISITTDKLKVRASVRGKRHNTLLLNYINPQEPSVRQLVNWFRQPPGTPPRSTSSASILEEMEQIALQHFNGLLDNFLEQTDIRLLKLAEVATNNEQQSCLFEAKNSLRTHQQEFRQLFCNHLRHYFQDSPPPQTPSGEVEPDMQFEDLALVDQESFEDWLTLDTVMRRANDYYLMPLACLQKRFDKLLKQDIDEKNLPVGIYVIGEALGDTIKSYNISRDLLSTLYHFFEETVLRHLDDLYDALNIRLKNHGVLPNIETRVMRESRRIIRQQQSSYLVPPPPESLPGDNADETASAPEAATENTAAANNPALFSTARDLITLLHAASPGATSSSAAATAPPGQLISSLAQLQHNQQAIDAIAEGASLQDWLQQTANVSPVGDMADLLQLIGDVFATLNDYRQIPTPLVKQLRRLQIPIAKAALMDSSFFSSPRHPAKQLLNQLIELCLKSDMPNRSLETRFDAIVRDIIANFEGDDTVFTHALTDLSSIADQQHSAYARNTQRIAQTYEGRQRVQKAEQAVDRELLRRVSPPEAPNIIVDLLDNGWRELLKLTYIKQGPDSEAWVQYLNILDQLLVWLGEHAPDHNQSDALLYNDEDADTFADRIYQTLHDTFPGNYRYHDTVATLRGTLKGIQPLEMASLADEELAPSVSPSNDLLKELEAAHPQLIRWFKRARSLQVGDEFAYLGDDTGQRNIKLAWISEDKQHFVFVNSRGQKVYDYDLVDLANELSKGLAPVEEQSEWPLVERSLYSTVQRAYEKLAYNSSHDELTGLVNRKECERLLSSALTDAKNNRKYHCLLYVDIDNFSLTNNLHGHVAGDQLLLDISQLLKQHTPEKSLVGRMAGNEFIVLLNEHDARAGSDFATTLLKTIASHAFQWQDNIIQFTASIGLVAINKYTDNMVELLRNAIASAQTAKKGGGNRIVDFRQDAETHSRRDKLLGWIDKLNSVLNSDKLCLRAQRIAPAGDNIDDTSHYEVLLGIRNNQGGLDSPAEFIEAAECYNRMQHVDRWVIENAFRWLHSVAETGRQVPSLSINLSGNSLNDEHFIDFILEQFARYKVPTPNICFEVTETATIDNLAEAADFIREVKKIGCRFSLDDFGSGNASYQYLKHLPVDYLKIDGLFVREMDKNQNDFALVKSINEIAHLMGMKTIAEFAESETIIKLLGEIGVDYIQGYAISKPIPLDQLQLP